MKFTYSARSLFDEARQIRAAKLKRWGYLEDGQIRYGEIAWSLRGDETARISFHANLKAMPPYIEFNYKASGNPINYRVLLEPIKSNLGRGCIWYFRCPMTGERCRILYGIGQGFFHRKAFKNCYYEKQTYSKKSRTMNNLADTIFGAEKAYNKIYKKYFKKFYAGKPTKGYLKLLKQIEQSNKIPPGTEERLFFS